MRRILMALAALCLALPLPAQTQCPEGTYHADTQFEGNVTRIICKCLPGRTLVGGQCVVAPPSADNITDRSELAARIEALNERIAETQEQLRGLGFQRAVPDFSWFAGQSEKARQSMVSQLVSRVRDYTIAKSEAAMEERFLAYIGTMKPKQLNRLADSLQRLGANEPLFQEWLRSFSPRAPRKVLVNGAKLAIDAIKHEKKLFKIAEEMDRETVQGQQEAALTVISMLGSDYPVMRELKSVAGGSYDVIEAWATIYVLDRDLDDLTTATETQLVNQKKIVLNMKTLVDERQEAREKLARLPPTLR